MAQTRQKVTVWWLDDHWGRQLPELRSMEGERTEKMVYVPERVEGLGFSSQIPVGDVFFSADDAVASAIESTEASLRRTEREHLRLTLALKALTEIKDGL